MISFISRINLFKIGVNSFIFQVLFLFFVSTGLSSQVSNRLITSSTLEFAEMHGDNLIKSSNQNRDTIIVRGRTVDSKTNRPVPFADISYSNKAILTKTNSNGEFIFSQFTVPLTIKIRKFGYKEETILINSPVIPILIPLTPLETNKKYLNRKITVEYAASLLKRAVDKLNINGPNDLSDLSRQGLVYCRNTSSVDSSLCSLLESYAQMNVSRYSLQGYKSEIARFASTDNSVRGIAGNQPEFIITPFIKIPFFVDRQIRHTGFFDQDGVRIVSVGFDFGEMEITYYIDDSDTSIVFIKKKGYSKLKQKLPGSPETWKDNENSSTEISFTRGKSKDSYQIVYIIENETFKAIQKNEPGKIISRNNLFAVIPDSFLINNAVKEFVLKESLAEPKQQINFKSKYSTTDKNNFLENEIQKLLKKPYYIDFWTQNSLIKPDLSEQKRIQSWEIGNRFYSENRLSHSNETIGIDSLVTIMNKNIVSVENAYIELDRPDYLAGDTIWFSAFILDNLNIDSTSTSKILYVDLINAENKLEKHMKLFIRNGRASGDFILNRELENGIFRIRAYTKWMRNLQGEFLFEKNVPVYQSTVKNLFTVNPVINRCPEGDSVNLYFQSLLPSGYNKLEKQLDVFAKLNDSLSVKKKFNFKYDFYGSMGFFVPASLSCPSIDLKLTLSDTSFISEQRVSIPLKPGINIRFFPESGKMVAGINTVIAYKAVDNEGNPSEFDASIVDENQKIVMLLTGDKSGIGKFDFTPQSGKTYSAIVTLSGNKYVFNLPVTEPTGYILTFNSDSSAIFIKNNQVKNNSKHYLLASIRGAVCTSIETELNPHPIKIPLPFKSYPKGIVQITLFDSLFHPLAERLVFNNKQEKKMLIHIEPDKNDYQQREKVSLTVFITDAAGNPVQASLAITVVDASKTDSLKLLSNIESYLFLGSELKGVTDYSLINLADTTPSGVQNIDLIMLTQGWRNYLWNSIRYNNSLQNFYPVEKGFYIDGRITNYNTKRPVNDYKINFLDFTTGYNNVYNIDENGKFKIDFSLYYDTHYLLMQNRDKKDKVDDIRIILDTVPVPEINFRNNELPYVSLKQSYLRSINNKLAEIDSINNLNIKYIKIPEVIIKVKSRIWYSTPHIMIDLDKKDPTGERYSSLFQMITEEFGEKAFTGLGFDTGGKTFPPILVVNGAPMTAIYCPPCYSAQYPWAASIPVNEISNVKFYEAGSDYSIMLTPPAPPPGGGWMGFVEDLQSQSQTPSGSFSSKGHAILPVVSFTTYSNSFRGNPSGAIVMPFQEIYQAREFYQPDYQLKNKITDDRTTFFWNPEVNTDSTGKAYITFYNSDLKGEALISVSGVSFQLGDASASLSHHISH